MEEDAAVPNERHSMKKRIPLRCCALALAAITLSPVRLSVQSTAPTRHPNIVIILADDEYQLDGRSR
jgi:hypothetical protein